MTGRPQRVVTGALYVDMGQQSRGGDRWIRPPRARYECLLCRTTEGPVTGTEDVIHFNVTISDHHKDRCTPNAQGAHAA